MTATTGDIVPSRPRQPLTGERFRRERESSVARSGLRRSVLFFLGLTIVWIGVLWTVIFGSRPHVYLLLPIGIYLAGVLSGAGISTILRPRTSERNATSPAEATVEADVHTLSGSTAAGSNHVV